ncbi:hypothetical protein [Aureivirga sp. CE67]|uniref:hypothetical protein n=1 Tax=Aureivirga sp. CE67 TaxID=1788983 RepID=UPI0018CBBFF3|nr:hypothetical protein [Aureivirga sp. CE67]
MRIIILLLIYITNFWFNSENKQVLGINEKEISSNIILKNKKNIEKLVQEFNVFLNNSAASEFNFYPKKEYKSNFVDLFFNKNVIEIKGFGNKKYKNWKKIKEADLEVFLIKYKTEKDAKTAFLKFKEFSKEYIHRSVGEPEIPSEFVLQTTIPKSGSFIFSTENYIVLLAKRCRGNRLNIPWDEYEELFLNKLNIHGKTIEVVHSDCGDGRFSRKKITM